MEEIFVARQPIFDTTQEVYGYELLYRSGAGKFYSSLDGDSAASEVITNSFLLIGLETLTRGKKAFINFTRHLLENETATLLPNESIVVEILEDSPPDAKMIDACFKLKELGYHLALDDFRNDHRLEPLLDLVDIVKVNFLTTPLAQREAIIQKIGTRRVKFLAERVETREDFDHALELGYTFFQGYFFSKPLIVSGRDIPSFKLTYLKILQEVNRDDFNYDRLESLIKRDISLSYKLLKFINSMAFGFRSEIRSIKQALVFLGQKEISKWLSLIALKSIGDYKPDELVVTALCRARFCELMASLTSMQGRSSDLYLMGLFSMVDAFFDMPIDTILADLPLAGDIKRALLGEEGQLRDVYELVLAYEKGDWDELGRKASRLGLDEREVKEFYLQSLEQANEIFFKRALMK